MLVTDPLTLNDLIDGAHLSLFRLETLERYEDGSDGADFGRYMAGEPGPDPERKARWHKVLAADLAKGIRTRRVHVVQAPPSDYLRYEFEWGYAHNLAYEDIRIVDAGERAWYPDAAHERDFWLIDGRRAAVLRYDGDGRYLGFEDMPEGQVSSYGAAADVAWRAGVPFADWWDNHPQYHRDSQVAA